MSYQMIHMEIAYRLLERMPQIKNKDGFILGAVAPDSVHMNSCYCIDRKIKSHMFEDCGEWGDTRDYQRWERNMKAFYTHVAIKEKREYQRDFLLGMCVHCLTDYWNDIKIWRKLQKEFIPPMQLTEFRDAYYPEARGIDLWLYQTSIHTGNIRELLLSAQPIAIEGFINKDDLEKQKSHLLNTQYRGEKVDISEYHFLSGRMLEAFMEFTVADIAGRMGSEGKVWKGRCE